MTPLSLYEINEYIRQVISLNFTEPLWIRAEINQISFSRGHCYLELIEKKEKSEEIIAQANAAIWFRNLKFIEHKTGPNLHHILKKGLQVLLKAKIEYNERYGLKFSVEDIDTNYTLGQLELQRRAVLEELKSKGLLEKNKTKSLPLVLQRLAIISSEKAAGLQDFISHLQENAYDFAFRCELFSAAMQGKNVEREILKACTDILAEKTPYDAVIVIRGGGSKLDLSAFDSLKLCTKLAQMPFPVITGIGHDVDQSIADLVAHTSLKTPTAVANFIIDHNVHFEASLFERLRILETEAKQTLNLETKTIRSISENIKYLALKNIQNKEFKLREMYLKLKQYTHQLFTNENNFLANIQKTLPLMDPVALLKRGYSITTSNGRLITSIHSLVAGDQLETKVQDGIIKSTVH